jgi:hypothetical protein
LKVKGTDKTFQCAMAGCGQIVRGKYNMDQHMGKHDREPDGIEDRKCKLEGCVNVGYIFKTKQVYITHTVSVVLETNGRFSQLTMSHLENPRSSRGTGRRYCWKVCW